MDLLTKLYGSHRFSAGNLTLHILLQQAAQWISIEPAIRSTIGRITRILALLQDDCSPFSLWEKAGDEGLGAESIFLFKK
jgi:hypothetical protein